MYGIHVCLTAKKFIFSVFRYWRRLYNNFDRELHPRQSELDCLMTVKEETQQLEEELAIYEQVECQIFP